VPAVSCDESIELLVGYMAWAGGIVLRSCDGLTDEQMRRELGGSQGSLLNLLRHVYDAEKGWLQMLRERHVPPFDQLGGDSIGDAPETLEGLVAGWPKVWAEWSSWFEGVTPNDLGQPIETALPGGRPIRLSLREFTLHTLNHSSLHRGQIVTMLRMLGAPCRNVDMMGYLVRRRLG
jgi:uncharacterized damage-inducible protein DinB